MVKWGTEKRSDIFGCRGNVKSIRMVDITESKAIILGKLNRKGKIKY